MKKQVLIISLCAALLLSGCSNGAEAQVTTTATQSPSAETEATTTSVSALEGAPESTTTEPAYTGELEIDYPDEFPVPYPVAAVQHEEMLTLFKEIITDAVAAESILHGSQTLVPLKERVEDDYYEIDAEYAETKSALSKAVGASFATYYWSETYGATLDYLLFEDTTFGMPRVAYKGEEEKLCFYNCADEPQPELDLSTCVITYLEGTSAEVVALGTLEGEYYWKTFTMINGYRGWVVEATDLEKVSGEIALFSNLLIDQRATLDKIFGNAKPVIGENSKQVREYIQIADDPYGHGFYYGLEVEAFMTVEEMRQFIRETFTSEIAESYISLYVNRSYVEKDGRLFLIEGAVLPQMGTFSLQNYQNFTTGTFDVTSYVEWTDGTITYTLPVTVKYEDGVWKLDTRLPMMTDRIIGDIDVS